MRTRRQIPPILSSTEVARLALLLVALVLVLVAMDRLRRPGALKSVFPDDAARAVAAPPPPALALRNVGECQAVDRELLAKVNDKTPAAAEDRPAVYQLLCVAATWGDRELRQRARTDVQFANLFNAPGKYRGEPVRMEGVLARLILWDDKQDSNPYGIARYYEAWIFPEDQPLNPVVFLFTDLPDGLAPGSSLKETVWFEGFFLKLLAFQTREGKWRSAPMLVGRRLGWQRPPASFSGQAFAAVAGIVSILLAGGVVYWRGVRRDERLAAELSARAGAGPAASAPPEFLSEADQVADDSPADRVKGEAAS